MDRISYALGWIGGAATMYWTLALGAIGALWAATWILRAGTQLILGVRAH